MSAECVNKQQFAHKQLCKLMSQARSVTLPLVAKKSINAALKSKLIFTFVQCDLLKCSGYNLYLIYPLNSIRVLFWNAEKIVLQWY